MRGKEFKVGGWPASSRELMVMNGRMIVCFQTFETCARFAARKAFLHVACQAWSEQKQKNKNFQFQMSQRAFLTTSRLLIFSLVQLPSYVISDCLVNKKSMRRHLMEGKLVERKASRGRHVRSSFSAENSLIAFQTSINISARAKKFKIGKVSVKDYC